MIHYGILTIAMVDDDVVSICSAYSVLCPQFGLVFLQSFHRYSWVGVCELRHWCGINTITHFMDCSVGRGHNLLSISVIAFRFGLIALAGIAFTINLHQVVSELLPDSPTVRAGRIRRIRDVPCAVKRQEESRLRLVIENGELGRRL